MVISSSIGFSYPLVAPKMEMRGLVRSPLVKGAHCSSSSSNDARNIRLRLKILESPLAYPLARRSPLTPDSIFSRKFQEMTISRTPYLRQGRDFDHFRVFLKPLIPASGSPLNKDLIIRYYVQTLSQLFGRCTPTYTPTPNYYLLHLVSSSYPDSSCYSEEEAVEKIYSVATRHYYAFGANVSCELAGTLKALPNVCAVHPDEYVDPEEKRYPWDPFINGQALPYDGKYYPCYSNEESWMASQETLPDGYGETDNGLGVPMAGIIGIPDKEDVSELA